MPAPGTHSASPAVPLRAVHVCRSCGAGTPRSGVSLESMINGLVRCCACGYESPLNVEVLVRDNE